MMTPTPLVRPLARPNTVEPTARPVRPRAILRRFSARRSGMENMTTTPSTATIATAARSASVGASSNTSSVARHGARSPGAVDCDVGERRLRDLHHLGIGGPALRVDLYGDGDGRRADALDLDVERDEIADLHRLLEHELLHRHGRDAPARDAPGGGATGDIDLRHDPAAEDVAVLVRVRRHRHDAQRRLL